MHEFEAYPAPSPAAVLDVVRRHPFALLVTNGAGEGAPPVATHTPVIVETLAEDGGLVGAELLGHVARKNPQWQEIADGDAVTIVFSGPHGYVSPTTYDDDPNVPTWDYAAVHLTARAEILQAPEDNLYVVTRTVEEVERQEPRAWDHASSVPTFERILPGVVSMRLRVTEQRAVFKLSQDKPADVRARVTAAARAREGGHSELAELMDRTGGSR